jgi:hypothetical protein
VDIPIPDRPKLPTSIKRLNKILSRHALPDIPESDLEESFIRGELWLSAQLTLLGRGPGGQAINKTSSNVMLRHVPTGLIIKAQPTRLREKNREAARKMMREKLDDLRAKGIWDPLNPRKLVGKGLKDIQFEDEAGEIEGDIDEKSIEGPINEPFKETGAEPMGKPTKAVKKEEEKVLAGAYSREEIRGMKDKLRKMDKIKKQKRRQREKDKEKELAKDAST